MAKESSKAGLPTGRIGKLNISRLIIGGNQFSGWSHSRDLPYLRELFDFQIRENVLIAKDILSGTLNRQRPCQA